jgi:hypothetical protein
VALVVRARLRRGHDRGAVRRDDGERLTAFACGRRRGLGLRRAGRRGYVRRVGRDRRDDLAVRRSGNLGLRREGFEFGREAFLDGPGLVVELFERGVDVLDVRLFLDRLVAHHVEHDLGHPRGLAALRALEDDVLHLAAAEVLHLLLAEHPRDGVGDVRLAAAVGADDRGDTAAGEDEVCVVCEGLEAGDFEALEFEHAARSGLNGMPRDTQSLEPVRETHTICWPDDVVKPKH